MEMIEISKTALCSYLIVFYFIKLISIYLEQKKTPQIPEILNQRRKFPVEMISNKITINNVKAKSRQIHTNEKEFTELPIGIPFRNNFY